MRLSSKTNFVIDVKAQEHCPCRVTFNREVARGPEILDVWVQLSNRTDSFLLLWEDHMCTICALKNSRDMSKGGRGWHSVVLGRPDLVDDSLVTPV